MATRLKVPVNDAPDIRVELLIAIRCIVVDLLVHDGGLTSFASRLAAKPSKTLWG
jgi:hypothetical protein